MRLSGRQYSFKKTRLKKPAVYCLPGFHVDPVWNRTQAEYIEQCLSLVRQYLLACRADPYFGVYLSEIDYLKPYLDLYPEERSWLIQLIQQKRCATGGAYNQPNETSIGGEALIRNILTGLRYHNTMTGSAPLVYMTWDVYGHVPQLPQILVGCDLHAAVFTRTNYRDPGIPIPGVPDLFRWVAPNGDAVYARRIDYMLPKDISLIETAAGRLESHRQCFPALDAELLIDAGDMHPPRTSVIGNGKTLYDAEPSIVLTGAAAENYFARVDTLAVSGKLPLELVTRDLTQYNEGCELSRVDLKIANRLTENMLFEAEIWGAVGLIYGIEYPHDDLDKVWRQLFFGQHHDALTGCGSETVFIDLMDGYRDALTVAHNARQTLLESFSTMIATHPAHEAASSVLAFNCLPWKRDGIVRHWLDVKGEIEPMCLMGDEVEFTPYEIEQVRHAKDGTITKALTVWIEDDIPATGYRRRDFVKQKDLEVPFLLESLSQVWIENDFLRVEVDPDRGGGIVSLIDKESGKEFIRKNHAQPANDIMALDQGTGDEPAWRLLTTGKRELGSSSRAEVKYMEGPVTNRLMIRAPGPGPCNRIQEIRLYRGLPYIDCITLLENYHGHDQSRRPPNDPRRDLYVAVFPLDLPGSLPVFEDRFYAKAYRRSQGYLDFYSTFRQWDSKHAMNACYQWVDVSWSLQVRFVNGKEELGSIAVGPSELVTPEGQYRELQTRLMRYLSRHGVTCTPRRDTDKPGSDRLFRSCSFCLGGPAENAYTKKLLTHIPKAKAYLERCLENNGYAILAVRYSEGDFKDFPVFIFAGNDDALTSQAVDEMIHTTIAHRWDCSAEACFPGDIESMDDFGLALLNRGSTLCSQENDGTLALALMHTVPYPEPQTPWQFDFAEQKNHLFQYRLIPHRGDWRHAEIPRRAMEYNHELTALETAFHDGPLPPTQSFFSIEPSNVVISAIKPEGFLQAEYRSPRKQKKRGTIFRFYEAHGEESNVWLEFWRPVKGIKAVRLDEKPCIEKREVFREEQFIRTVAHANEIITLNLDLQPDRDAIYKPAEAIERPVEIVPARYWRYNRGAAPAGFLPLSLSIRGQIRMESFLTEGNVHHLDLVVVNNSPYESADGEIEIQSPPYWRILPSSIRYRLSEGSYQIIPLTVIFDGREREGFIKASTRHGGTIVEDVLHIGPYPNFDLSMTLTRDAFNIKLKHPHPYEIAGSAQLVTPLEIWPETLAGEYSLSWFEPRSHYFSVKPDQEIKLSFNLTEPENRFSARPDHHWTVVKMSAHHCVRYYHVRMDGRQSEGMGCIIQPPYERLANR